MTNKIIIAISLILVIGAIFTLLVKNRIGNISPAILPAKQAPTNTASDIALKLEFPLSLNDARISEYATNISRARDLAFSPRGTLLVVSLDGKVYALPSNPDGTLKEAKVVVDDLDSPHGLAFYQGKLFVAEETSLKRYNWDETSLSATLGREILTIPRGGRHSTRSIEFDRDGNLYISIGSTCDVCFETNPWHGSIIQTDQNGTNPIIYSKGLRNAVFLSLNPQTNQIWATEMGRDFLGDNLPPDEVNILSKNSNFGWPLCFGNRVRDTQFNSSAKYTNSCNQTTPPTFELPAHVAPLGLTFINSPKLPKDTQGDLLVALHGSWNSSVPVGYKIVKIDVEGEKVTNPTDFITGFLDSNQAFARPVDVIFDKDGNLFFSDDKGGRVYRVNF